MGFEISYMYHERLSDGTYNTSEKKELKKKVGSPLEDVPLEQLAAVIMTQLARRNIWVVDVEIHEYTKKKISFKESPDGSGIVIKNKKFGLDNVGSQLTSSDVEEVEQPSTNINLATHQLGPLPSNENATRASNHNRVRMWMVFDPEPHQLHEAKMKNLKFSVSKKYPIYATEPHPTLAGQQMYTTVDDAGNQQMIRDEFFVPATVRLVGEDEVEGGFSTPSRHNEPKLTHQSVVDVEMPVLR